MRPVFYNLKYGEPPIASQERLLPYGRDPSKLRVGQRICVGGYVNVGCGRFAINLLSSRQQNGDVAFHFNPRMKERRIFRNSRIKGQWGKEETRIVYPFDFAVGRHFQIDILVTDWKFIVSVNDRDCCEFTHRIPFESIIGLEITGEVDIQEVFVKDAQSDPVKTIDVNREKLKHRRLLPYVKDLVKVRVRQWICVTGYVSVGCNRFSINLLCGLQQNSDIAFHFNARIDERCIVRNSQIKGYWGGEERHILNPFDFAVGTHFQVDILMNDGEFWVAVNGRRCCAFSYRIPLERIIALEITREVDIQDIFLKDHIIPSYFTGWLLT